jgi:RHS repeat-associated protein
LSGGNTGIVSTFTRGEKLFELSNHLGNVLVTLTDKKLQHTSDNATVDYYVADVASASDYYPFGMQMPSRNITSSTAYRYGFNGKELDPNMDGNNYDYGFRIYNPQIGRFLSTDPLQKKYPELTPYQFASNTPIQAIDLDGLERAIVTIYNNAKTGIPAITVTTDKKAIEAIWKSYSVMADNMKWLEGKTTYKWYMEGAKTNSTFPQELANAGVLFIDQRSKQTTLSFEGFKEENQVLAKQYQQKNIDENLRQPGRLISWIGDGLMGLGVLAAPFTEGASLSVVEGGDMISNLGLGMQVSSDVMEGKWNDVLKTTIKKFVIKGLTNKLGKLVDKGMKGSTTPEWVQDYLKKKIESTSTIIENSVDYSNDKKKEDNKKD